MLKIITQELEIELNLKQRLEFICVFCHIKPKVINDSIRKIDDYFKKISENSKNDLACEIIIEFGDKEYWDTKDNEKYIELSNELYSYGIFNENTIKDIKKERETR